MTLSKRTVHLQQVPEQVTPTRENVILQHLQKKCAETERPLFVLDCSLVRTMDTATIHLLLSCLEEVMKCNGDVRLAALCPEAEDTLRLSGVSRLFETYPTAEAAILSFQKRASSMAPLEFDVEVIDLKSGLAA